MGIESDIIDTLNNHSGLSQLVSDRNYAIHLPQKPSYPNTVFMRVSTTPQNTLTVRNALTSIRLQIDSRDRTYDNTRLVSAQVKDAMEKSSAFLALYINDNDIPVEFSTDTYRVSVDFSIWFYDF